MSPRNRIAAFAMLLAAAAFTPPALAQGADSFKTMLKKPSDDALDRLSKPGAFSADEAIKIGLPGSGGQAMGGLLDRAGKTGLTGDLDSKLNRAAELAAGQAKPIFRVAIDKVTFSDAVGILRGGDTGATDYLKQTTGAQIEAKLSPLVKRALGSTGAMAESAQLRSLGFDAQTLTRYVTGKTSDSIFSYVGREETAARKNPIGTGAAILKGFKF